MKIKELFSEKHLVPIFLIYTIFLPFSFQIQSIVQSKVVLLPLFAMLGYLVIASIVTESFDVLGNASILEKVCLATFVINMLLGFVFTLVLQGEYSVAIRNLIVYILPTFLLFSFGKKETRITLLDRLCFALIAVGLVFAVFQIYSYSSVKPTFFEQATFDYIQKEYGAVKGEFLGSYRRQGPTDHIHVTSLFLAISAICAFLNMLKSRSLANFIIFYTILLGFWATGVRLSIISAYLCFAVAIFHSKRYRDGFYLFFGSAICLAYLGAVALNSEHFMKIYIYPIMYLDFTPDSTINDVVIKPAYSQLSSAGESSHYMEILFGHGFSSQQATKLGLMNDDLFLVQIFTNFGLLGLAAFYGLGLFLMWKLFRRPHRAFKFQALLVLLVLFVMLITTVHSGVIFRRIIFPFFIMFLAFARYLFENAQGEIVENEKPKIS